jgi:hypothetical protein
MQNADTSLRFQPRLLAVTSTCLAVLAACGGSSTDADGTTAVAPVSPSTGMASVLATQSSVRADAPALPNLLPAFNDSGFAATYSLAGAIDRSGPFFQSLGTNGRGCASCHVQAEGWTITPRGVQARFLLTAGTDPIFRTNDGRQDKACGRLPRQRGSHRRVAQKREAPDRVTGPRRTTTVPVRLQGFAPHDR